MSQRARLIDYVDDALAFCGCVAATVCFVSALCLGIMLLQGEQPSARAHSHHVAELR